MNPFLRYLADKNSAHRHTPMTQDLAAYGAQVIIVTHHDLHVMRSMIRYNIPCIILYTANMISTLCACVRLHRRTIIIDESPRQKQYESVERARLDLSQCRMRFSNSDDADAVDHGDADCRIAFGTRDVRINEIRTTLRDKSLRRCI